MTVADNRPRYMVFRGSKDIDWQTAPSAEADDREVAGMLLAAQPGAAVLGVLRWTADNEKQVYVPIARKLI